MLSPVGTVCMVLLPKAQRGWFESKLPEAVDETKKLCHTDTARQLHSHMNTQQLQQHTKDLCTSRQIKGLYGDGSWVWNPIPTGKTTDKFQLLGERQCS